MIHMQYVILALGGFILLLMLNFFLGGTPF